MMARIAEYRNDISGQQGTAGTSTAYTLVTNQVIQTPTPSVGQMLGFTPHTTCGASPTIAVDGGNAYPIQSSNGTPVVSGALIGGTPYTMMFGGSNAWILRDFYNPNAQQIVPVGGIISYAGATAPNSSFALCGGQAISRTGFAVLFALVGVTYGGGDGSTTFNLPDLRGRAPYGQDNMTGSAAGRITAGGGNFDGTVLGNSGGAQNHTQLTSEMPAHSHAATVTDPQHSHTLPNSSTATAPGNATFLNVGGASGNTGTSATGISVTNANTGGGNPFTVLNPALITTYLIRVI
jgi:microcystin-dependent protein